MGSACSDNRTTIEKQVDEFLRMLSKQPDLSRYLQNQDRRTTFQKAWNSPVFGGSVLKPVGTLKKKNSRPNSLEQSIKTLQIQSLSHGGYYVLEGVQEMAGDSHRFVDIYILVQSVEDISALEKMRQLYQKYQQSLDKNVVPTAQTQTVPRVLFDQIKDSLNGFARMIYYKVEDNVPEAKSNELIAIEEGEFKQGLKNGYVRGISAQDGSCAVGFHVGGVPNGKWTMYKANGEFALPQGLYEGSSCTQRIEIANFHERILKVNKQLSMA